MSDGKLEPEMDRRTGVWSNEAFASIHRVEEGTGPKEKRSF